MSKYTPQTFDDLKLRMLRAVRENPQRFFVDALDTRRRGERVLKAQVDLLRQGLIRLDLDSNSFYLTSRGEAFLASHQHAPRTRKSRAGLRRDARKSKARRR